MFKSNEPVFTQPRAAANPAWRRGLQSERPACRVAELGSLGFTVSHLEEIATQLRQHLEGKTLATVRDDATKEMNGVCWQAIRPDGGPRRILWFCITEGYELRKLDGLDPAGAQDFGDWDSASLAEAIVFTMLSGRLSYAFDLKSPERFRAVMLIAADPVSITSLEQAFRLPP